MKKLLHVLLIENCEADAGLLLAVLRRDGFDPVAECVRTVEAMRAALSTNPWDVVLCDDAVSGIDPPVAWRVLQQSGLDLPFIIISDTGGEDLAVTALKHGASDYLLKDRLARLGQAVLHAMEETKRRQESLRMMAALRRSEEIHRNLIEAMSEGVAVQDRDGRLTFMNRRACEMLGYTMGELVGRPVAGLFDPENQAILREQMARRLKGARDDYEIAWLRKDGGLVNTLVTPRPRFDAQGVLVESVAVITDITGRKLAEEQLKLRSAALEAAANAIFITDHSGVILWANSAFVTLSGFPMAEIVGRKPSLVKSGAHDQGFYRELWATILAGKVWQGRITNRSREGRLYIAEQTIAPVKDDSGATTHFVTVQQDITARQKAEDQLREQAALLDKAHDAIIVRDLDHRVRFWNRSAEQIYGWTAAEAVGRRVTELIYFDDLEFKKAATAVVQHGGWAGELRQVRKDGGEIIVDSSWTLVRDQEGRPSSFMSINTDITEKKKLAAQFHRIQRLDSIGTLAGGIAHDLNNVLAPMLMAIELLRLKHDDADTQRLLAMLETNGRRGAQMLRQMLAFGRGGGEGVRVVVSPVHVVREVAQIVHDTFPKSIRCASETAPDPWPVTGDPTELHQVLLNLCVNARDAMPDGGVLSLRLENTAIDETYAGLNPESRPGPYVLLSVTDTGTGVPPGLHEKIFEPFFHHQGGGKRHGAGLVQRTGAGPEPRGFRQLLQRAGQGEHLQGLPAGRHHPGCGGGRRARQHRSAAGQRRAGVAGG